MIRDMVEPCRCSLTTSLQRTEELVELRLRGSATFKPKYVPNKIKASPRMICVHET